ncbi:hypothetical protein DM860_016760 [Cuscuta australis]|uniref:DNA topoisomerase (ATP-hydrolyzing) n=1 Tax=Cuscuta australis TaxID=267555 RepID=A0A328DEX8_9ASTE|nr:hypothetical protein DM860_016760 [Cuscuta australis]
MDTPPPDPEPPTWSVDEARRTIVRRPPITNPYSLPTWVFDHNKMASRPHFKPNPLVRGALASMSSRVSSFHGGSETINAQLERRSIQVTCAGKSFKQEMDPAMNDNEIALARKHVLDLSYFHRAPLILDGKNFYLNSFEQYFNFYLDSAATKKWPKLPRLTFANEVWGEVCVSFSPSQNFLEVCFLNDKALLGGGYQVEIITQDIVDHLVAFVNRNKAEYSLAIDPAHVKNHLWIFLNLRIPKDMDEGEAEYYFYTTYNKLPLQFLRQVSSSAIRDAILLFKLNEDMRFSDGSKLQNIRNIIGIEKLFDAELAGTKRSKDCTLILTEGDSGKALVMNGLRAGLSYEERKLFGVYPLRGKLLNVKQATHTKINE